CLFLSRVFSVCHAGGGSKVEHTSVLSSEWETGAGDRHKERHVAHPIPAQGAARRAYGGALGPPAPSPPI
ncbi:hypothetical protein HAX54_037451, partial [Datura stramonium]|nr:hypothetical protein [Datura stramonium]